MSREGSGRVWEHGSCTDVRDLLPEHALGTLEPPRRRDVERHLAWCAGCRREATELAEGSAVLGMAAGRARPPDALEQRVATAVSRGAGGRGRSRTGIVAAVVAAFLAVAGAGWGTVMAGRAQRLELTAESAQQDAQAAARRFSEVLRDIGGAGPVREAVLRSGAARMGGGRALLFDSDAAGTSDWVLVLAGGLPERRGPYHARLIAGGRTYHLGRMQPGKVGQLAAYSLFPPEVGGYERLVIVDAADRVVLEGGFGG